MPALFAAYPTESPSLLLGTNKLSSICGTTSAVLRYMRVVRIPWRRLLPAAAVAFVAALSGASLVNAVSPALFRPLVPIMLTLVLLYVLWHKDLGARHAPISFSRRRGYFALAVISVIGLYDGFFGPGTGSFLMLLFIRLYGFDFLHASAGARAINVATNAGALLFFGLHGEVNWGLGLALGTCNAAGSVLGARTALKHGSKFVRMAFIGIVIALIAKTGYDGWINRVPNVRASFASHPLAAPTGAQPNDALDWMPPSGRVPIHAVPPPSSSSRLPRHIPAMGLLR